MSKQYDEVLQQDEEEQIEDVGKSMHLEEIDKDSKLKGIAPTNYLHNLIDRVGMPIGIKGYVLYILDTQIDTETMIICKDMCYSQLLLGTCYYKSLIRQW